MKYTLIMLLFLWACGSEKPKDTRKIPKNLLSKEQVIKVLVEINLAEAMVSMANLPFEHSVFRYRKYERHILKKLQIDSAVFMENYHYYIQNVDDGEIIYRGVQDSLLLRQAHKNID